MITSLTYFRSKLPTGNKNNRDSGNLISGIYCTVWSAPSMKWAESPKELVISDLRMFSLTLMDKSKLALCTLTPIKTQITRNQLTKKLLYWPQRMWRNFNWELVTMTKTIFQKFSQSDWQWLLREFLKIHQEFMTWKLSLLIKEQLMIWSTDGKTQNTTQKFSEVSSAI